MSLALKFIFSFPVYTIEVMLGAADTKSPTSYNTYVETFTYWDNVDLALLRLIARVAFTPNIQPIRLPSQSQEAESFEGEVLIQGFGGGRRVLQYGNVTVLPRSTCDSFMCSIGSNLLTSLEPGDTGEV